MISSDSFVAKRPAVHRLAHGAFLQERILIDEFTLVEPLQPIGLNHLLDYAAQYHREIFGVSPSQEALQALSAHGQESLPAISIIHLPSEDAEPQVLLENSRRAFDSAEQIISWISGNYPVAFIEFVSRQAGAGARLLPPMGTKRLLLGFGNIGPDQQSRIERIVKATREDERFAFALSLYRDAMQELNPQFQMARLFTVLEALAHALKRDGVGSRNAVRTMLGVSSGATGEIVLADGRKILFDRIELAGRLRDKLFHGVPFERSDLTEQWRDGFELIQVHPDQLIGALKSDCDLEIARWANGASVARSAAEASSK